MVQPFVCAEVADAPLRWLDTQIRNDYENCNFFSPRTHAYSGKHRRWPDEISNRVS